MLFAVIVIWSTLLGFIAPVRAQSPAAAAADAGATVVPGAHVTPAAVHEFENGIKVGTRITMANWQQYKAFMPDGMVEPFQGSNFWKMPP